VTDATNATAVTATVRPADARTGADTRSDLRVAYLLSAIVAVVLAIVSAGGVFIEGLYNDNALISQAYRGQDMVTLLVAVPLLVVGLLLERRGSARGRIVWLAMLAYTLYGYLFYMLGAAFNPFFLLYVAAFALSLYALVLSVPRIDVAELTAGFSDGAARWVAIVYMLVSGVGLGVLWTGMSVGYLFTGDVPAPIVASGHPTGVVFALDLSLIVPAMIMGAVLLLRRRPWGWLLAGVMSVKGSVYTLGLAVATIVVERTGVGSGAELPIWAGLTVLGALSAVLLLANLRSAK
jgi:hypothetical protein